MRNLFTQIKQSITFFFLMVLITFTGVANATVETWVASGVRQVQLGSSAPTFLQVSEDGFASETLCNSYIGTQNNLTLGIPQGLVRTLSKKLTQYAAKLDQPSNT